MKTTLIAAALLASVSLLQTPALAQSDAPARLQLTIVDATNAAVPNAIVTVFTIHGPRTVNADEKGIAVVADLPAEMTQVWARTPGLSSAEVTKLKSGENKQTLTLRSVGPTESGS